MLCEGVRGVKGRRGWTPAPWQITTGQAQLDEEMTMDMTGKTVFITGASRGIGAEAARVFAGAGANVALIARGQSEIAELAGEIGETAIAIPCNVANYRQMAAAVEITVSAFGGLDVLINNAGVIEPIARLEKADPEAWSDVIDVNLKGVFNGMHAVLPVMKAAGGGSVLTISSGAAHGPVEAWSHYCASKAARAHADAMPRQGRGRAGHPRHRPLARHGRHADAARDQGQRHQPGEPARLGRAYPR